MSDLPENSKVYSNFQEAALKKISDFITRLHSNLLPKTTNSGVFRNLSEEEEYLLTNLTQENVLHSILAGCLAIDSCLANIRKFEKVQGDVIMRAINQTMNSYSNLENQARKSSIYGLMQRFQQFGEQLKILIKQIKQYPLIEEGNVPKEILHMKDQSEMSSLMADLNLENVKLKEQLVEEQKKRISVELKIRKFMQSGNTGINQEKHQIEGYRVTIKRLKEEKNHLLQELQKMEEQIRILSKYSDTGANYLLEELEYEMETLKEEKRHDEKIMAEIQMKMAMMCISKGYRGRTDVSRRRPRMSEKLERPPSYLMKESRAQKMFDYSGQQQKRGYMRQSFINQDDGESVMRKSMKGSGKKEFRNVMSKKMYPQEGKTFNRMKTSYL